MSSSRWPLAPNTNAFVERFIQSIGQECLDRFLIFGEQHMNHVCQEYLAHYHEERPHQSLDNDVNVGRIVQRAAGPMVG